MCVKPMCEQVQKGQKKEKVGLCPQWHKLPLALFEAPVAASGSLEGWIRE